LVRFLGIIGFFNGENLAHSFFSMNKF